MVKLTKNQKTYIYVGAGAALVGSSILLGLAIAAPAKTVALKV